jgi:hypothetical protein
VAANALGGQLTGREALQGCTLTTLTGSSGSIKHIVSLNFCNACQPNAAAACDSWDTDAWPSSRLPFPVFFAISARSPLCIVSLLLFPGSSISSLRSTCPSPFSCLLPSPHFPSDRSPLFSLSSPPYPVFLQCPVFEGSVVTISRTAGTSALAMAKWAAAAAVAAAAADPARSAAASAAATWVAAAATGTAAAATGLAAAAVAAVTASPQLSNPKACQNPCMLFATLFAVKGDKPPCCSAIVSVGRK